MTDTAVSVTQSAVEEFADQYLRSLGCSVEKDGDRWEVVVPKDSDTDLSPGKSVLICDRDAAELDDKEQALHAESAFFQDLLSEASGRAPTGKISLTAEDSEAHRPPWLRESDVDLVDVSFSPYYDRTALVLLVRVSVETVSDYQTELLQTVALDARSKDRLPGLEETFLELTSPSETTVESDPVEMEHDRIERLVDHASETAVVVAQSEIDEIHREASRAAETEVEDYRQMQQQQIEHLEERVSSLSSKLEELNRTVEEASDQADRVDSLEERNEVKGDLEEAEAELEDLRRRREQGFPDKQSEIRERHRLEVVVTPLTMTQVEYERGEATLELREGPTTRTMTVSYGSGVGVTEDVECEFCAERLTERNQLETISEELRCDACVSTSE